LVDPVDGDSHGNVAAGHLADLAAFGLKPQLVETWKLSTDPQLLDKVRDIVTCTRIRQRVRWCYASTKKPHPGTLDRTAPSLPVLPTPPARMAHGYVRHGATSLFAALDVASRSVITEHHHHRDQEFLRLLKTIDTAVPAVLELHLIRDNCAAPLPPALALHPPVAPGPTSPTAGSLSWPGASCAASPTAAGRSRTRRPHWISEWNKVPYAIHLDQAADETLDTLAAHCLRISDSRR
jgi:hypothetical protein